MIAQQLLIHEIFSSIQGESTYSGLPCTFVRLSGCSLRCKYCDTSYAFRKGGGLALETVVQRVLDIGNPLVEITGGEPLLQKPVFRLMEQLCDLGLQVMLETSGDRDIGECDSRVIRIIDIKTPNSGAAGSFLESNYDLLTKKDEVKFVITNREDFEWALYIANEKGLHDVVSAVHFSPVMQQDGNDMIDGCLGLEPEILAKWILESGDQVRLHLQLHRYVWEPNARGV